MKIPVGSVRWILICSFVFLTSIAWGDSLQLRDGRHFDGQYVGGTQSTVAFFTNGSVQYFGVQDVLLVVFGNGANTDSVGPVGQQQSPIMKPMAAPGHQKNTAAGPGHSESAPGQRSQTTTGMATKKKY